MLKNQILFLALICFIGCKGNKTTKTETMRTVDEKSELQLADKKVLRFKFAVKKEKPVP